MIRFWEFIAPQCPAAAELCRSVAEGVRMATEHEQYEALREKWVHEDNLVNHRVTWLLYAQTILFAAYGILLTVPKDSPHMERAEKLIRIIPVVGIANLCVVSISIAAAVAAHIALRGDPNVRSGKFVLWVPGVMPWVGYTAPVCLPIVFLKAWIIMIVA